MMPSIWLMGLQVMTAIILYYLALMFFVLAIRQVLEWDEFTDPLVWRGTCDKRYEWSIIRRGVLYIMLVPLLIVAANVIGAIVL